MAKTITMNFPEDGDFDSTVEDCMTDFIDTFLMKIRSRMKMKLQPIWNYKKTD
jgi:hypothetical protein